MNDLKKQYHAAPRFDSPASVDNAVLSAAARHVDAQTQHRGVFWRWAPAVSVMSLGVLSLTLVMRQGGAPMSDSITVSQRPAVEVADIAEESSRFEIAADIAESLPELASSEPILSEDRQQHSAGLATSAAPADTSAEPPRTATQRQLLKSKSAQKRMDIAVTVSGERARQWYANLQDHSYIIELAVGADVSDMLHRTANMPQLQPLIIVSGEAGNPVQRLFATPVFANRERAAEMLQSLGLAVAKVRRVSEARSQ